MGEEDNFSEEQFDVVSTVSALLAGFAVSLVLSLDNSLEKIRSVMDMCSALRSLQCLTWHAVCCS
jgi:hypothetical protein